EQLGQVVGVDVRTGATVKKSVTPYAVYSGVLSTGGDLVFTAYIDGKIAALDSDTLAELWSFNAGTPISAPPITYALHASQYVAIQVGGQDQSATYNRPELKLLKRDSMLMVFGL